MTPDLADHPWARLTLHFFRGLFDFGVLSEAGADAFRRMLIGLMAAIVTSGLLLTRMYVSGSSSTGEDGQLAALAGEALVIGLPMWVVAAATLLISASLFPTETDVRVLFVLPVSKRTVFGTKLLALALFSGLFIVATQAAALPLFLRLSLSAGHGGVGPLLAHLVASVSASIFVVLGTIAFNGVLLMALPGARAHTLTTAVRTSLLAALVLSGPLVIRLPGIGPLLAGQSPLLLLAPPLWFLGIARVLLGATAPYFNQLALVALVALVVSLVVAVTSYTWLYRRIDLVVLRPAVVSGHRYAVRKHWWRRPLPARPVAAAIGDFTDATLARSALHQGVFVAVAACGAGLLMNSFLGALTPNRYRSVDQALRSTAVWAPFALVFGLNLAVRAALVLPLEPRANWVFRLTENRATRADQLQAVAWTFIRFAVVWPVVLLFPIEWAVLGPRAVLGSSTALMAGLVLVELRLKGWQRLPFTCSYIPGKRFVGHTLLIGLVAFAAFTMIGTGVAYYGFTHPAGWLVIIAAAGALVVVQRRRRLKRWRETDLTFEDSLPTDIEPLQLTPY